MREKNNNMDRLANVEDARRKSPEITHMSSSGLTRGSYRIEDPWVKAEDDRKEENTVTSRRDFLRNSFFSLMAPSLMASPLLRHGGSLFMPEAGDLMSEQALREGSLSQKSAQKAPTKLMDKRLSFYNIHTGESLKNVAYFTGKTYVNENLCAINKLFRDHRTEEIIAIDPKLLDLMYKVQQRLETDAPFHLISGFRSPKTNAMLQANSCGVATQSQHCLGKAADISLPKTRSLKDLHKAAKSLRLGGVGIYSQFVHIDTGRVRCW